MTALELLTLLLAKHSTRRELASACFSLFFSQRAFSRNLCQSITPRVTFKLLLKHNRQSWVMAKRVCVYNPPYARRYCAFEPIAFWGLHGNSMRDVKITCWRKFFHHAQFKCKRFWKVSWNKRVLDIDVKWFPALYSAPGSEWRKRELIMNRERRRRVLRCRDSGW